MSFALLPKKSEAYDKSFALGTSNLRPKKKVSH